MGDSQAFLRETALICRQALTPLLNARMQRNEALLAIAWERYKAAGRIAWNAWEMFGGDSFAYAYSTELHWQRLEEYENLRSDIIAHPYHKR